MLQVPRITFNNGLSFPALGLGTWQGPPDKRDEVGQAVKDAIDLGYRHIDCASSYQNESIVGEAIAAKIADGPVKREDLFVTSKLGNTSHLPERVEVAIKKTLNDLQLGYLDLYLIHWAFGLKEGDDPYPRDSSGKLIYSDADYTDTWRAMEKLQEKGLSKSIGISNFNSLQIDRLLKHAKIKPAVLQIECHPYLNQKKMRQFCGDRGIVVTGYSPLGSPTRPWRKPGDPGVLEDIYIKRIGEKYGKTPAQVLLRYQIQLGNATIPKASIKEQLVQNIDIFDFKLSDDDMEVVNSFNCNGRMFPSYDIRDHPFFPFQAHIEF